MLTFAPIIVSLSSGSSVTGQSGLKSFATDSSRKSPSSVSTRSNEQPESASREARNQVVVIPARDPSEARIVNFVYKDLSQFQFCRTQRGEETYCGAYGRGQVPVHTSQGIDAALDIHVRDSLQLTLIARQLYVQLRFEKE